MSEMLGDGRQVCVCTCVQKKKVPKKEAKLESSSEESESESEDGADDDEAEMDFFSKIQCSAKFQVHVCVSVCLFF